MSDSDPILTPSDGVLDRYLAGEATLAERESVDAWLADDSRRAHVLAVMRGPTATRSLAELDTVVQRIERALDGSQVRRDDDRAARVRNVWLNREGGVSGRRFLLPVLGVLLIGIAASVHQWSARTNNHSRPTVHRYTTSIAQRATVSLADGTRVTLGPQSTLEVPLRFGSMTRTIALKGQAYFDVRTTSGTPFIVRSGSVTTRVLGTTFGVRQYPGDRYAEIAVTSGKIIVTTGAHSQITKTLDAGAVANATDSVVTLVSGDSAKRYTSWVSGQLIFRGTPTSEVLATLTRWYGYQFRLSDSSLNENVLTAVIDAQSSAQALSTIKLLLNVDLTFDGNVITLHPKHRSTMPARRRQNTTDIMTPSHAEVGR